MKVSCKENCRMTKKIRESDLCTGICTINDDGIIYDCEKNLKKLSEEDINEYSCLFLDLNALEKCNTCYLRCKNNKNKDFEQKEKEMKELQRSLDTIVNFGVSADMAEKIVQKHKKAKSIDTESLEALKLSNTLLAKAMSGSGFDIAHFQVIAKNFIKNVSRKKNQK